MFCVRSATDQLPTSYRPATDGNGWKVVVLLSVLGLFVLVPVRADSTAVTAAEMPVIAYIGVPPTETTAERFREFRACGFTVSLQDYPSLEALQQACRVASQEGVQILGGCPEMHSAPERTAAALKNQVGFFGYNLQDEPTVQLMRQREQELERIRRIDTVHVCYINLLPHYDDYQQQGWGTSCYEAYLDSAAQLGCQQISFDYYPVTRSGLRSTWLDNLDQIRHLSLRTGKPFWAFILSIPHVVYPQPTRRSLRLQTYVNLAYGAQCLQYFSYWTLTPTEEYDFHNAPIDLDGRRTRTYYQVQRMNRELMTPLSDRLPCPLELFQGARVDTVWHNRQTVQSHFWKNGRAYKAQVNLITGKLKIHD